jgi:3'(2'), 5'-bisphosphate nucleotidase
MKPTNLSDLAFKLLPIARGAGDKVMSVYKRDKIKVDNKPDKSPLTEADIAAHNYIVNALKTLTPEYPIISEEDKDLHISSKDVRYFWLIDPLDGTKEFLAHNDEFTVNIALIAEGQSILGVVYAPAIDCIYWGGKTVGAFRAQKNQIEEIKVTSVRTSEACRVVASKSHLNAETELFIRQLGYVSLVQAGSSLKFCRIAEGSADIYPRLAPTCEWDTAAAQAILEGAGGLVLDLDGQPLSYGKLDNILNPSFIATSGVELIPKR